MFSHVMVRVAALRAKLLLVGSTEADVAVATQKPTADSRYVYHLKLESAYQAHCMYLQVCLV
jgi:hypothetical protein